jgi:hypothetical protein
MPPAEIGRCFATSLLPGVFSPTARADLALNLQEPAVLVVTIDSTQFLTDPITQEASQQALLGRFYNPITLETTAAFPGAWSEVAGATSPTRSRPAPAPPVSGSCSNLFPPEREAPASQERALARESFEGADVLEHAGGPV